MSERITHIVDKISIRTIFDLLKKKEIDLNPEYQRNEVWTESYKLDLLKSIIKYNYSIKDIELNKRIEADKIIYVIIDGKQRLSTIRDFLLNKLPYLNQLSLNEKELVFFDKIPQNPVKPYKFPTRLLTPEEKRDFLSYQISTIEYTDLSMEVQQRIFKLSQNAVKTSIGELIKACSD